MKPRNTNFDDFKFLGALEARVSEILSACTACGDCVRACPMTGPAGVGVGNPEEIAAGLLAILKRGERPEKTLAWIDACTGSGACIPACPEGLNARFMVLMARATLKRARFRRDEMSAVGNAAFRKVTNGVFQLSRLQLSEEDLAKLGQAGTRAASEADLVFHIGCNVLRTPHIALLCVDVLDRLEIDYRIAGGPAHCCGINHFRAGDLEAAGRIAFNTVDRFGPADIAEVCCWCPTCAKQFGEIVFPAFTHATGAKIEDTAMFPVFLLRHMDALRPLLVNRVARRVALHEHPGLAGVDAAVRTLLEAVPGLEFVDLGAQRLGSMCSDFGQVPEIREDAVARLGAAAREAGVDTLAGIYHACHRELCSHQREWPFEVVNFMELIGESMGVQRPDSFKRIMLARDVEQVMAESADLIAANNLDPDEVRAEVLAYFMGG